MSECCAALQDPTNGLLNLVLGGAVDGAGRVIQDQDAGIGQQRARNRQALALASGERDATFADDRVVAIRKTGDEIMGLGITRGLLDRLAIGSLAEAESDVLGDAARKEKDILLDGRDLRAQPVQAPVAHVDSVDQDTTGADVIGAIDQLGQRALAGTGLPDNGNRLAGLAWKVMFWRSGSVPKAKVTSSKTISPLMVA